MTPLTETVDRRVVGGIRFVDGITGNSIQSPLQASCPQLTTKQNRSGIYVIFNGPGYTPLTNEFIPDPSTWPTTQQTYEVTVSDPSLRYLPRRANVTAPMSLTALTPQNVSLYSGPSSAPEANWAVVRASVVNSAGAGLPYAVIQIVKSDNSIAATGVSDARGEALLAVPGLGLQVSSTSTDPVTEATTAVTLKAYFDPSTLTQPAGWVPNPDDILTNLANTALKTGTQTGAIGPRETFVTQIVIAV